MDNNSEFRIPNSEFMDGMSMDIEMAERDKLRSVFPQCFSDGRLDIDKLLSLCGEYITDDFEKYEFRWKGKSECLQLAGKRSMGTLRPCPEESVDFDSTGNIYIEGDNLEVLKLLQTSYYRKVKMIYIDPPYNTGNDFVYADDFADPLARYREVTQQTTKSNPETMGRFHTNWLNMMYPRLRLAANLLRDDGVIFISIDDGEITNLRRLCDEILGEENFIAQVVWQKRTSPDARRVISPGHEYVLIYTKNLQNAGSVIKLLPFSDKDKNAYKNPDNDPRGPWVSTDCTAQAGHGTKSQFYTMVTPAGRVVELPDSLCWRYTQEKMNEEILAGRIWFGLDGKGVPRKKTYLSEREGRNLWTWWPNNEVGHTQSATQGLTKLLGGKIFDFSKPIELIQRCLSISTDKDSIILDFFSGSATTAHAVMQLNAEDGGNRRFILVQLPEVTDEKSEAYKAGYKNICEIGKERIRRAGRKIRNSECGMRNERDEQLSLENNSELRIPNSELDTGFRVFKLDSSNLKVWDDSPITGESTEEVFEQRLWDYLDVLVEGRSDMDLVYEVMLKLGQDLCLPVVPLLLEGGRKVYGVGEDIKFIVCLAKNITPEDAEAMAAYAPGRIVFAEQCFTSSTDKSNVRLTLKDKGIAIKTL